MIASTLVTLGVSLLPLAVCAQLQVSPFFGDHMVLQREQPLPVWGKSKPGDEITVTFRNISVVTQADANGKWQVDLPPQSLGEPGTLEVKSGVHGVAFKDVLVGEVWICSGQSNMEWPVENSADAKEEIVAAKFPSIRLFDLPRRFSPTPVEDMHAKWQACSPDTIGLFSAVGYFFGRELSENLSVPIGLVSTNWGGSPAEAWTPLETLASNPAYKELVAAYHDSSRTLAENPDLAAKLQKKFDSFMERAGAMADAPPRPDPVWFDASTPIAGTTAVRPNVEFLTDTDGLVQARRIFSLSPEQAATPDARLLLGQVDNYDVAWVNGVEVGRTGRDIEAEHKVFRDYKIPGGTLRPGPNVVVLQIVDWHRAAFFGKNIKAPEIRWADDESFPLPGDWEMKLVTNLGPRPDTLEQQMRNAPAFLYNGMIAPLVPAAFRGVIWYQGESNATRAEQYRTLFPDMIKAWRGTWNRGNFPFYFVQLANINNRVGWPALREAQRETLALPNTGMAVTIDLGDPDDVHPRNKRDVGRRLALLALARTYDLKQADGTPIPHSGPLFREAKIEQGQIRLLFDHMDGGLKCRNGGVLKGFTIAEMGESFLPAEARIEGNAVVVSRPGMSAPRDVRYAWATNPEANLVNGAGLPASPFRTDQRPLDIEKE